MALRRGPGFVAFTALLLGLFQTHISQAAGTVYFEHLPNAVRHFCSIVKKSFHTVECARGAALLWYELHGGIPLGHLRGRHAADNYILRLAVGNGHKARYVGL